MIIAIGGQTVLDTAGHDGERTRDGHEHRLTAKLDDGENAVTVGMFRIGRMAQIGLRLELLDAEVTARVRWAEGVPESVRVGVERELASVSLGRDLFHPDDEVRVMVGVEPDPETVLRVQLVAASTGQTVREIDVASAGPLTLCQGADLADGDYRIECVWSLRAGHYLTSRSFEILKVSSIPAPQGVEHADERARLLLAGVADCDNENFREAIWIQVSRYALGRYQDIDLRVLEQTCDFIATRQDCADFSIQAVLRLLYWEREEQRLSPEIKALMKATALGFKYWVDEPGDTVMYMGSENHRLLFHVAEWMAGQLFGTEEFTNTGQRGLFHAARGRTYIMEWLRQRGRFGFDEWHSNSYLPVCLAPLANVYDFTIAEEYGPGGTVLETPGQISKSPTSTVVLDKAMNHFNVHGLEGPLEAARWNNALQRLAEQGPHGIPVTVSTDPRHAFVQNSGVGFAAKSFSQWPETLGLAAIDDLELIRTFADVACQEYAAVGIRAALHPQVDLATEPRWGRQAGTFGHDAQRVSEYVTAYLQGFQGDQLGPDSVACVTKHFPGGGPQLDGEDGHFPYGREQVYPGGQFDYHLEPFRAAIAAGTAGLMPYYGMPVNLEVDLGDGPEPIEAVGFGYNHQIITRLLRERLGYDGVVVTDWELVMDNHVGDQVLPARAWGVEALDPHGRMLKIISAGCDQLGGEECVNVLLDLVGDGRISEQRIDESARRVLLVKFQLGLFDDPYVDEDAAAEIVGRADFTDAGFVAQARSVTVLENRAVLPVAAGSRLYVENVGAEIAAEFGTVVDDPDAADVAIVRLTAPFQRRDDLFLEAWFRQGTLEFTPGLVYRMRALAARAKLIIVVNLDRPAILTPLVEHCAALVVTFGVSDRALLAALSGAIAPEGRLPMEIPRSMDAVRASRTDVPSDTVDPVYPLRAGGGW